MKHSLPSLLTVGAALLLGSLPTPARAATMILHNFTGDVGDGANPYGSLTLSNSKLYGLTSSGGSSSTGGALFSMNPDGTGFGLLHSFTEGTSDGFVPFGSLTLSGARLYGTTNGGGSSGSGTVFGINTDGSGFGLLHSFTGSVGDGIHPVGSLTLSGSKLYGMAQQRFPANRGSLFSLNTDGTDYSVLHTFTVSPVDGRNPSGSLTLSGSILYGMTPSGGSNGVGTLFSINTDGSGFGLLHSFGGGTSDGANPFGSLTLSGSTLYGMTRDGGNSDNGTLFSIGTDGSNFRLLERFGGSLPGGGDPHGDLTLSDDGSLLYGMTYTGGTAGSGVVFSRPIVPEPGTFALLGPGALLLAARRRKSRPRL